MNNNITVNFEKVLQEARFLERPNRFLLRCVLLPPSGNTDLSGKGETVDAHLADPGRLRELLVPGKKVWLRAADGVGRKTKWSAVLCESPAGDSLVSIDSTLPNRLIGKALAAGAMEEFQGWSLEKAEYTFGGSRWDFLLTQAGTGRRMLLEVKSVTLVEGNKALFPDAITARGAKHVRELAQIAKAGAFEAAILFVAQREEAERIQAAPHIDPVFAEVLAAAKKAGVGVYGRKCSISLAGVSLGKRLPAG